MDEDGTLLFDTVTSSKKDTEHFLAGFVVQRILVDSAKYEFAYNNFENYWKRSQLVQELEMDLVDGGLGDYLVKNFVGDGVWTGE